MGSFEGLLGAAVYVNKWGSGVVVGVKRRNTPGLAEVHLTGAEALEGRIFITGGTGFLARAVVRRAALDGWPATFTCMARNADNVRQFNLRFPRELAHAVVGDVRDRYHLTRLVEGHDLVLHFAAQKHIPLAEQWKWDAYETNVRGTANVLYACADTGVPKALGVSTDKACRPLNFYGTTKRMLEGLFQDPLESSTSFHLVRYGNVVGSTGSVIPVWQAQVDAGGPITITAPDMTRFWMSADEAVRALLRALKQPPGHIWIPKCAAMRVSAMAKSLHPDVEHRVIGARPGEKHHEDLLATEESAWASEVADGFVLAPQTTEAVDHDLAYSSDAPARFLAYDEFRAMVELGDVI